MIDISKCERIEILQGAIYLGPSNKKQSAGYLELNPFRSLALHNRPAIEKLTQIKGKCEMILFLRGDGRIITLNEKDILVIEPAGTYHIHANPFERISLTYWDFDGDVTKIINDIKKQ